MRHKLVAVLALLALCSVVRAAGPANASEAFDKARQAVTTRYEEIQNPYDRAELLLGLKVFDEPAYAEFLIECVDTAPDKRYAYIIRHTVSERLSRLRSPDALRVLVEKGLTSRNPSVRKAVVRAFSISDNPTVEGVLAALQDKSKGVKAEAADAAIKIRDTRAIPLLIELLSPRYPACRLNAHNALVTMTGCVLPVRSKPWREWWDANKEQVKQLPVEEKLRVVRKVVTWPVMDDMHFGCRTAKGKAAAVRRYANPKFRRSSQRALENGLKWLASHQEKDGHWDVDGFWTRDPEFAGKTIEDFKKQKENKLFLDGFSDPALGEERYDLPATGFCLMAFCGAGYTHRNGSYKTAVAKALDWLIAQQNQKDGSFDRSMYVNAICTHAIAELWGLTRDLRIKPHAQKAVDYLCYAQKANSGWRYAAKSKTTDSSVSSWCTMALQTAYRSGLYVPAENLVWARQFWDKITVYSRKEAGKEFGQAFYTLDENDEPKGSGSQANTAGSILCRIFMGTKHRARSIRAGAAYLEGVNMNAAKANIYMWLYVTQGLFQMGGPQWREWEARVMPGVIQLQLRPVRGKKLGSPGSFYADTHWLSRVGRIGITAVSCIILESYYFYPKLKNE